MVKKETVESLAVPVSKDKETMKRMLSAGLHFGHRSASWHPKMDRYIFKERNGMHIVDLTQTVDLLNEACEFLMKAASKGEVVIVGTKKQAQEIVEQAAKKSSAYYVTRRWPGGLLTNFKVLKKRIDRLNQMLEMFEKGIENRTKKELMDMKKELRRLAGLYGGLRGIKKTPGAVVVVDAKYERIPVAESKKMGVPSVGLLDTNTNPEKVTYPIPGNDDASKSIRLVVNTLADAILAGNKGRGVKHEDIDWEKIDAQIEKILVEERKKKEQQVKVEKEVPRIQKRRGKKIKIIKKKK